MRDEEIVALYWERNEDAIRETSRKYDMYLKTIAGNILADARDSEECVNDTYLRTWNAIPDNRPNRLSGFLGRITRALAVDRYRKNHAQKRYASEYALSLSELDDLCSGDSTPEQKLLAAAFQEVLNTFLRSLPPQARTIFICRYFFFDSVKRIAAISGVAEGTVKSSLYRTRQLLKEYLTKEGYEV